jgi:hypothetical protein
MRYRETYPIDFGGRRWWLTIEETNHLKLIQQCFPSAWESEVYKHIDILSLGETERDLSLQAKIKQAAS